MIVRIIAFAAMLAATVLADSAGEIATRIEQTYTAGKTFSVNFSQVVQTGNFFDDEKVSGVMLLAYPEKFRIETSAQTLVSDGDTLWTYSEENRQVTIEPMNRLEDVVTPADYLFRLRERYDLTADSSEVIDKRVHHRLSLRARDDDYYVRSMRVYVDPATNLIRRVVYRDINDNRITLDFSDWKLGAAIKSEQFRFKTPSGVEEVRVP